MKLVEEPLELPRLGQKDSLFLSTQYVKPFEFNEEVAEVFDDMARRSIPLYDEVQKSLLQWAWRYAKADTTIYDIGCSTGSSMFILASYLDRPLSFIGIDNSKAMLLRAEQKLQSVKDQIQLVCDDALNVKYRNASMIILNYTLQFIPVANRLRLLKKLYDGLVPGGLLFMSEKASASTPDFQETMTRSYEMFKQNHGYSRTEIERKKEALDSVLVPLKVSDELALLKDAGFDETEILMKWNHFVTIAAVKR